MVSRLHVIFRRWGRFSYVALNGTSRSSGKEGDHERKKSSRKKFQREDTRVVRKVIDKVKNKRKMCNTRELARKTGVGKETVRKILHDKVKKHWNSLNSEFLKPYYDSMPDCMDSLIECEGNKINY